MRTTAKFDRNAYQRERAKGAIKIYFRDAAEKAEFLALAETEGIPNFSQWVVQKLLAASSGTVYPPGYVEDLQKSANRHREWLEQRDAEIAELRKDLKVAVQQREDLRVLVAALGKEPPRTLPGAVPR